MSTAFFICNQTVEFICFWLRFLPLYTSYTSPANKIGSINPPLTSYLFLTKHSWSHKHIAKKNCWLKKYDVKFMVIQIYNMVIQIVIPNVRHDRTLDLING